jgi:hypothetical protein
VVAGVIDGESSTDELATLQTLLALLAERMRDSHGVPVLRECERCSVHGAGESVEAEDVIRWGSRVRSPPAHPSPATSRGTCSGDSVDDPARLRARRDSRDESMVGYGEGEL